MKIPEGTPPDNEHQNNYPKPSVTADILVFCLAIYNSDNDTASSGLKSDELGIVLIKRNNPPFKGKWALPGGFVDMYEDIQDAATRELEEETGLTNHALFQFKSYGAPFRDPRGRTITIAYLTLTRYAALRSKIKAGDDAAEAAIFSCDDLPDLGFDHLDIIRDGRQALLWLSYSSNVLKNILDPSWERNEFEKIIKIIEPKIQNIDLLLNHLVENGMARYQNGEYAFR